MFNSLLPKILRVSLPFAMATASAHAQVVLDGSVGPALTLGGPEFAITEQHGTQTGANLFHSFSSFNINTGESATFSGPDSVANVIARVTGGSSSSIDGLLRNTIPNASLFLLNPAGVMFGPNASLDVSGSFHVSTADYLRMADGAEFHARAGGTPGLTTAPPIAFGFLSRNPQPIVLSGSQLQAPPGKTLAMVGGEVRMAGARLSADAGRIDVVSISAPGLATFADGLLKAEPNGRLGNISVVQSSLDASSDAGGAVSIRGGKLTIDNANVDARTLGGGNGKGIDIEVDGELALLNGSKIRSISSGNGNAGSIDVAAGSIQLSDGAQIDSSSNSNGNSGSLTINARESVAVSGSSDQGVSGFYSNAFGSGDAGPLSVFAKSLEVDNSGRVKADTFGNGKAGNVLIDVARLTLNNGAQIDSSSRSNQFFSNIELPGNNTGAGGALTVNATESVSISGEDSDGFKSGLLSNTSSKGNAGFVTVETPLLTMRDGRILSRSLGGGNAGSIEVKTDRLLLTQGAQIFSGVGNALGSRFVVGETDGLGDGGKISVSARESIFISGLGPEGFESGIFSSAQIGQGAAGAIDIATDSLMVERGGAISSLTGDRGNAGSLTISARSLSMTNGRINSATLGSANGGGIVIKDLERMSLTDGAQILSGVGLFVAQEDGQAFIIGNPDGLGSGGDIIISARGAISIAGASGGFPSGIFSSALTGGGSAGNISVAADRILLGDGAAIDSRGLSQTSSPGKSGKIDVQAVDSLRLLNGSRISVETAKADADDIDINVGRLVHLRNGSVISTSVAGGEGDGGNINIDPDFVVLDNASSIVARARQGSGGDIVIRISENGAFFQSPDSTIDASSDVVGLSGEVVIDSPDTDVTSGVSGLPVSFFDASALLADRCAARVAGRASSFVATGRGGVPPGPAGPLGAPYFDGEVEEPPNSHDEGADLQPSARSAVAASESPAEIVQLADLWCTK